MVCLRPVEIGVFSGRLAGLCGGSLAGVSAGQIRESSQGAGQGELPGIPLDPWLAPGVLVGVVLHAVVTLGDGLVDVLGADDHDAVGLAGSDLVVGQGGGEVAEVPAFVEVGVGLGESSEDDLGADPLLAA